MGKYDFSGWATKANLKCSDGRIILRDAFKHNDGKTVPLVWNHQHNTPENVLGHALLQNRDEGVYAYCTFNDSESGRTAKLLVEHGDVDQLSIHANKLKQQSSNVIHGDILEVSLVLAGANPGACIDSVIMHGEESEEEATIYTGEYITLTHADEEDGEPEVVNEPEVEEEELEHADGEKAPEGGRTLGEVVAEFNDEQRLAMAMLIQQALDDAKNENNKEDNKESEGGNPEMKHNAFDKETDQRTTTLTHSDQEKIIAMARTSSVGSLRAAIDLYADQNESLSHAIEATSIDGVVEEFLPDYKDMKSGAPELLQRDLGWVSVVMKKVHKSPISRIRTRQVDVRDAADGFRAFGYKKGAKKNVSGNMKLLKRTTDPQTIYRKDALHRDDIVDITDFDVVAYQYGIMKDNLYEEVATAIMIGDGRDDGDDMKISEEHIRSIWHDDDLYAIHYDVDITAARAELQGTNTSANFGENYIYNEAIVTAALYSREQYKGSGSLDFFCDPHLVNVMLLARDLNGRRIHNNKADLTSALNVSAIHTAEQFAGKIRTTKDGKKKKLLGIMVNLNDYHVGSTKGGELTKFSQFDIDFNQEKYLIETRLSGALTRVYSAIVLEEDVTDSVTD